MMQRFMQFFPNWTKIVCLRLCVQTFVKIDENFWSLPRSHTHTHIHTPQRKYHLSLSLSKRVSLASLSQMPKGKAARQKVSAQSRLWKGVLRGRKGAGADISVLLVFLDRCLLLDPSKRNSRTRLNIPDSPFGRLNSGSIDYEEYSPVNNKLGGCIDIYELNITFVTNQHFVFKYIIHDFLNFVQHITEEQ